MGEHSSGDFALCFATGNRALETDEGELALRMLNDRRINPLYEAVIDAVEESILNALLAAETMTGRTATPFGLPHELLLEALSRLEHHLVDVAPEPVLARLERLHSGCEVAWKCFVACVFGELSQQPTWPARQAGEGGTSGRRSAGSPRSLGARRDVAIVSRWVQLTEDLLRVAETSAA